MMAMIGLDHTNNKFKLHKWCKDNPKKNFIYHIHGFVVMIQRVGGQEVMVYKGVYFQCII